MVRLRIDDFSHLGATLSKVNKKQPTAAILRSAHGIHSVTRRRSVGKRGRELEKKAQYRDWPDLNMNITTESFHVRSNGVSGESGSAKCLKIFA